MIMNSSSMRLFESSLLKILRIRFHRPLICSQYMAASSFSHDVFTQHKLPIQCLINFDCQFKFRAAVTSRLPAPIIITGSIGMTAGAAAIAGCACVCSLVATDCPGIGFAINFSTFAAVWLYSDRDASITTATVNPIPDNKTAYLHSNVSFRFIMGSSPVAHPQTKKISPEVRLMTLTPFVCRCATKQSRSDPFSESRGPTRRVQRQLRV